ncbi:MAG: extensin family protein [Polyangiaceae bacterium]|nr:extensin family protein [Polyangiaceae bacterium]
MRRRLAAALPALALATGCARAPAERSAEAPTARPTHSHSGWLAPRAPEPFAPGWLAQADAAPPTRDDGTEQPPREAPARADTPAPLTSALVVPAPPTPDAAPPAAPATPPRLDARTIPDGAGCLARLEQLGVAHTPAPPTRGVRTPIVVRGPLGGLRWRSGAGPMLADCRLVVVLAALGPALAERGVREVRFSGAYSYRMSRAGRLSLHAYGLAVDVHELRGDDGWRSVERDFRRGATGECGEDSPLPNHAACVLRDRATFRELLTPDYDAAHRDHLHVSIAPLPTPEEPEDPVTAAAKARAEARAAAARRTATRRPRRRYAPGDDGAPPRPLSPGPPARRRVDREGPRALR